MEFKRREVLGLAGGTAAGWLLARFGMQPLLVRAAADEAPTPAWIPRVPQWVTTVCQQCPGGCGVRVQLVQGKAINIAGNPLYPLNRGGICPKGITGLQGLYDPDRLKGPMQRLGGKGSNTWRRLSWEEALQTVAARLTALREHGEAHTVAILGGQYRGLMEHVLRRFAQAYGTPNYFRTTSCEDASAMPQRLSQGIDGLCGYDLENTNYLLSFGTSLLEAWWSPVRTAWLYGHLRQGRGGVRAKIVQVEPRFSMTAARADEWVPINPGSDAALALGDTVASALPWQDFVALLKYSVQGLYEAPTGEIVSASTRPTEMVPLQERQAPVSTYAAFEEFWNQLRNKGGWWDPAYRFGEWQRVLRTPSGQFEFFSQTLQAMLETMARRHAEAHQVPLDEAFEAVLRALQLEARGDAVFLPHWEPPRFMGQPSAYPLHLNTYKLMTGAMGRGANQPHLQEIFGLHVNVKWDAWVEINPATAQSLGIAEGDAVWVESPVGKVKTRAKLYPGAMPQVVNMPFGQGHTAYGRWAQGRGVNPNDITVAATEPLAGLPLWFGTRVRVYRA